MRGAIIAEEEPDTLVGLNYSHRQAARLGLDAGETFLALLIHLRPRFLRLSLFWDEIAPEPGRYEFGLLHWYLDRAAEYGCRVLLTVGLKPQRHPDFTPPAWLWESGPPSEERLLANVLLMLERAVALLADYDAIDSWQVENDALLPVVQQPRGWLAGGTLLAREIELIHDVDPRHRPVVVSDPGLGFLTRRWRAALQFGDVLGLTLSLKPWPASAVRQFKQATGSLSESFFPRLRMRRRSEIAARAGKHVWITEFDVEPGDAATVWDPLRGRAVPALPSLIASRAGLATGSGAARAYLVGVEQWQLKRLNGDTRWWEAARALLRIL